jgi:hypothetical protein
MAQSLTTNFTELLIANPLAALLVGFGMFILALAGFRLNNAGSAEVEKKSWEFNVFGGPTTFDFSRKQEPKPTRKDNRPPVQPDPYDPSENFHTQD